MAKNKGGRPQKKLTDEQLIYKIIPEIERDMI